MARKEPADRQRVSELARLRSQLEETRRQLEETRRLKTEFLARMSHDLRTPMNAIIGYTRILLRKLQGGIDSRQYQNLENIQTSAYHLLDLINDILDLSKVEAGRVEVRPEAVDLRRLFGECLAAAAPLLRPGVELAQQLDRVDTLCTDPDRLRRALKNLLSNAAKFTEQGRITLSARTSGEGVEIAVADTGAGIPAADLPHIFDAFRQVARKGRTAEQGTGLGLAIVKRSVELIGGSIEVASQEGGGTTFTLKLRPLGPGTS
jgi:signal transduction histidine kinase